jgi:hypothetical protein
MVSQRSPKPLVGVRFPQRPHVNKNTRERVFLLFLSFFVRCAGLAPLAVFLELDFASHELFVLLGQVVQALAFGALELY